MRILWLVCVVLVVAYSVFVDFTSTAQSAVQASQLANQTTARMLILIALTLAFWFVAAKRETQPGTANDTAEQERPAAGPATATAPSGMTIQPLADDKICPECGKTLPGDAVRCRYCGVVQPN